MKPNLVPEHKILLELIPADNSFLKAIQQKINIWITTKLLIKYRTSVVGNSILFEIVLKKEAE